MNLPWRHVVVVLIIVNTVLSKDVNYEPSVIFHYNNTYKYNVIYSVVVNKTNEYIMEFSGDSVDYDTPARVTVVSERANRTFPVFITARQQKGLFAWQLPMTIQTESGLEQFSSSSRTLCPHNNLFREDEETCEVATQNTPTLHLTSSSPDAIEVTILVETVTDFYVQLNHNINLTISPSKPRYYFYPFHQDPNSHIDLGTLSAKRKFLCNEDLDASEKKTLSTYLRNSRPLTEEERNFRSLRSVDSFYMPKSVILMIESDNDVCAVISIQNFSCPVFDNERDILYDGYYLTMTRRGGITLTQEMFPQGFYIVFIVKSSDEDCTDQTSDGNTTAGWSQYFGWGEQSSVEMYANDGRSKSFNFTIVPTISYKEYVIASSIALVFFVLFYMAFLAAVLTFGSLKTKSLNESRSSAEEGEGQIASPPTPHDAVSVIRRVRSRRDVMASSGESSSRQNLIQSTDSQISAESNSSSDSEAASEQCPPSESGQVARLCLADLARKRSNRLGARSNMYLYNLLTVVVFYTLPVIQLVVTYQRMLHQSGNQDLCYFNFLCAHPLGFLSDFNHVYSNLGYVMLGALFLVQVWRRHRQHKRKTLVEKEMGIPQHFGLFYAMGVALVSEGLLSAAYHVCPNSMNFQFDTSFMYVTSVLCMLKIYQSRHPDINARAHATFGVLAFIIFIGLVGVLNADFYFWIGFTILHICTCFALTFQIYYMGKIRFDGSTLWSAARLLVAKPLVAVTPNHCARCVLLFLANVANWALAAYGVYQHRKDFASHLLLILMGNLFIYTNFYIAMKLLNRERIRWYTWLFIGLTHAAWMCSSYFFLELCTSWALTPARSRQYNRVCILLELYDYHDIWHFLSSVAMFFSFNMYLTLDDNLSHTPREKIEVF